jgi:hypothetical protein
MLAGVSFTDKGCIAYRQLHKDGSIKGSKQQSSVTCELSKKRPNRQLIQHHIDVRVALTIYISQDKCKFLANGAIRTAILKTKALIFIAPLILKNSLLKDRAYKIHKFT